VNRPAPHALLDLARLFLKLGTVGFGGPAYRGFAVRR
jgi:chromate transport protein ChrA